MRTQELNDFLNELDERKLYYRVGKVRREAIMVEVAVPGQRWEIEFMDDGSIEIEKFISAGGVLYDESELKNLFENDSE